MQTAPAFCRSTFLFRNFATRRGFNPYKISTNTTTFSILRLLSSPKSARVLCSLPTMPDYTLYYMPTPNGKKISLALEELQLSYEVKEVDIRNGDQFKPEFIAINPNSKIPALVDHTAEGGDFAVFESGAILEYLADKHGKLMPPVLQPRARMAVKQWLYWQMAGFGPMLGQMNFFWIYSKDDVPVGKERYLKEALRLFTVLDTQLASNKFIAGDEYSIADIACYWWSLSPMRVDAVKDKFDQFENIKRWQKQIEDRGAVAKVNAIPFGQS
eukprot:TRINITY_DN5506_c0_g1_i1.p1 TRINITY_DN5506_c0_g1~~TRINITY_DN5506_c0_g1_i1.p1  ORF type:complete len:271 (-),score=40.25 TRINITY_DN5506_c0_g1_i1:610-1422(-)